MRTAIIHAACNPLFFRYSRAIVQLVHNPDVKFISKVTVRTEVPWGI